jgi:hypothetical protein
MWGFCSFRYARVLIGMGFFGIWKVCFFNI